MSDQHLDDPRARLRRVNQAATEERATLQARIAKLETDNALARNYFEEAKGIYRAEIDDLQTELARLRSWHGSFWQEASRMQEAAREFRSQIFPAQKPGVLALDAQITGGALEGFEAAFSLAGHSPTPGQPVESAPAQADAAAVDAFAAAMKAKLAEARAKGRSGWQTCPAAELSRMLREHVEKGDPRDVANFCMFLWTLGYGISPVPGAGLVAEVQP